MKTERNTMAPHKTMIATVLLFGAISLLGGCSSQEAAEQAQAPSEGLKLAAVSEQAERDVALELKSSREGDEITIVVTLDNPNNKPITSVQTWLSYDPSALEGVAISDEGSAFEFAAPYEQDFDQISGVAKVGRSSSVPVTDNSIDVATINFKATAEGTTFVDAFDYQTTLSGHTSANVVVDGDAYNVMLKPESPALIIQ